MRHQGRQQPGPEQDHSCDEGCRLQRRETESMQTLDEFVDVMKAISDEAMDEPDFVKAAPRVTRLRRLDETQAARKPVLRWTALETPPEP